MKNEFYEPKKGVYIDFREAVGKRESGNNYQSKNQFGFLGKYQFGKLRLIDLGYSIDGFMLQKYPNSKVISEADFLNNFQLQDVLFYNHVARYCLKFRNAKYYPFMGKKRKGIIVTLSGVVAVAHLLGIGGVDSLLIDNYVKSDANGTKATDYLSLFANYDLTGM